jgi:hypothetical protein
MSISYNVGGLLGGAISPLIATSLLSKYHSWTPIALYMAAAGVIGLVASLFLREHPAGSPVQLPAAAPAVAATADVATARS